MAEDQMLQEHRRQWHSFVKILTWSTVFSIAVLVGLAIFVA